MFIYKKEGALSPELCNKFIELFELSDLKKPGVIYNQAEGHSTENGKKSTDITFSPEFLKDETWKPVLEPVIAALERAKHDYVNKFYDGLTSIDNFQIHNLFNMQRYLPNEGFPLLHCERSSKGFFDRLLVWMIYLNDVTDKGETEFFYQNHFEKPITGNLLIWPADWTHLHRGIPSPTQVKYILTGWFNQNIP